MTLQKLKGLFQLAIMHQNTCFIKLNFDNFVGAVPSDFILGMVYTASIAKPHSQPLNLKLLASPLLATGV